jgi:hypothetical protein
MAIFLRGPASVYETDSSQSTATSVMFTSRIEAALRAGGYVAKPPASTCPDGYVMSEFGCVNPTRPGAGCPPGSQQTGYGCLPTNTTPPQTFIITPPAPAQPPAAIPPPQSLPPQVVNPPASSPMTQQSPNPGMVITTTAAPTAASIFASMPTWGWGLGLLAAAGGAYALYKRTRR